jgi:hypothetical protein
VVRESVRRRTLSGEEVRPLKREVVSSPPPPEKRGKQRSSFPGTVRQYLYIVLVHVSSSKGHCKKTTLKKGTGSRVRFETKFTREKPGPK